MFLALAERRQVVPLNLIEVGKKGMQLAGLPCNHDTFQRRDRCCLHRLFGIVDEQYRVYRPQLGCHMCRKSGDRFRSVA